jgi:UDP-N-acetylmuramoyl-L-alanyl-D-glutamate--2,6-diaminopimelate ligase
MLRVSCPPVALSALTHLLGLDEGNVSGDALVTGVSQDSRHVQQGDLFCCVRGESFDGHDYVADAVSAGAVAVLVDRDLDAAVPVVKVRDVREAIGPVASFVLGDPSTSMVMVGVTGTNGKTSTAAMIGSILEASGHSVEVMGTLTGARTTPEAIVLQSRLRASVDKGTTAVVMEVSSHALVQHRTSGVVFDVAVFTNFGRDHLDFHGTEDAYFAAKASLFTIDNATVGVVNGDDPRVASLMSTAGIPTVSFSRGDAVDVSMSATSVTYQWGGVSIKVPMGGDFSLMNSLAAARSAQVLGCSLDAIARGLACVPPVAGRFEPVVGGDGFDVLVDYAHTPESLEGLLASVRTVSRGRVILVFGCGGDRDRGKRPLMGEIAARLADSVIITSDNPRSEVPTDIIAQIAAGVTRRDADVTTEPDRASAIASAISRAERGDIVVIAGKGHETTQEIAGILHPFSDADVARSALARRKESRT